MTKGQVFHGGDWISLDGTTGRVIKGKLDAIPPKADDPELLKFMSWAEPFRNFGFAPMPTFLVTRSKHARSAPKG
jgi:hypothetical protein